MGITEWVKAKFGLLGQNLSTSTNIASQKTITGNIAGYLVDLSKFHEMKDNQVYSQLYTWEAEIGGAIDRLTTMVAQSYQGIVLKDAGKKIYPGQTKVNPEVKATGEDGKIDETEAEMLAVAKDIAESVDVRGQIEKLSELLLIYGNVYLIPNKDLSLSILPAEYVTFVEDTKQINSGMTTKIMTEQNYLVVNEQATQELDRKVYKKGNFIHIRYKDTPQICKDSFNRQTFGFYAISPLHRTVIPVWWKRQITIIDILARSRSIPREHHKIQSSVYSLEKYDGASFSAKRTAAAADAQSFMTSYAEDIVDQAPDQGYITLDTIDIKQVGGAGQYMQTNELLSQIEDHVWTALNIPPSVVNGKGASSYASELVISNYVSSKVVQLANKVKPVILDNLRQRVKQINPAYPVHKLDIKIELSMAASEMESFRQLVLMKDAEVFTEDEIRDVVGYEPLLDEQKDDVVRGGTKLNSTPLPPHSPAYPDTPQSGEQHTRDASQEALRDDEMKQQRPRNV